MFTLLTHPLINFHSHYLFSADSFGSETIHIVIEARSADHSKKMLSTARYVPNMKQLSNAIKANIPNVKLTVQDFAKIPYAAQVSLAHSAGVFVAMHGAGATHIMNMALGERYCCAMVELQPDRAQGAQIYHAPVRPFIYLLNCCLTYF